MAFKDFSFAQLDPTAALSLGVTTGKAESKVCGAYCGDVTNSACSSHSCNSSSTNATHCQSIQSSACTSYRR